MRKLAVAFSVTLIVIYLWYRLFARFWSAKTDESIERIYREILTSDKYKVKGRFEE